jgi:hypothetical protein
MGNNPVSRVDPDGGWDDCSTCPDGKEFDVYRNSEHHFYYEDGIVSNFDPVEINSTRLNDDSGIGWISTGKDITFGGGLFTSIWGAGFEAGVNYKPKYTQRGVTKSSLAEASAQFSKYARYASRAGNIITGADAILSLADYAYSDKSWGKKTKLGVNLGIAGLGLVRHPAAQVLSICLGISETAGAFNGLYNYADLSHDSGFLIMPSGISSPSPLILRSR